MNDLTGKISKLLEDPEIMKSISGLSQMLQNDNSGSEPQNEEKNSEKNSDDILSNFSIQPEMMDAILKIMPILSSIKKEDKYTMFLKSLKPLLSSDRQEKIEKTSHILKLIKILPILKNKGIF